VTPTPDPAKIKAEEQLAKVQQIMSGMTLDQKLGQFIIVEYFGADYQNSFLPYAISKQYIGGFLDQQVNGNFHYPSNTVSGAAQFAAQANNDAKIPLLTAIDQEGGQVSKLSDFYGFPPSAANIAASGDPKFAFAQGAQDAKWIQSVGLNTNLAPVVDVGPTSNLLEDRQFSDDPATVATYAGQFLNGLQSNGVIGCVKHFPGLGSLPQGGNYDPHTALPVVNRSKTDLENIDWVPYRTLIQQDHPAMIMTTDVVDTAIDPNTPAELSPKMVNGVLRGELGYNGVVITDGLYMGGIKAQWNIAQASVLAIIAGNDLVEGALSVQDVANTVQGLKDAIQQGQLSMDQVNQSVQRILLMKVQYGIIQ
jgi:beta-N-acetylhexosaminidase